MNTRIGRVLAAARGWALRDGPQTIPERLASWKPLPLLLLAVALSTVFIFGNDRGAFYRRGHHDYVTADHLGIAKNLSPQHNFLMFRFQEIEYNEITYHPYNRFPIGTHALVRIVTLPFEHGSSAEMYSARILMLLFFCGAAVLSYLSLKKLRFNRWIALAATMVTFSSTYALYYNDMVAPDGITNIFGIFLTLHGLIVFTQEKRMRQLLLKITFSLLMGWPVLALLLLFLVPGFIASAIREIHERSNIFRIRWIIANSFIRIGSFSLFISVILFGFNMINEAVVVNKNPLDTPSIFSLKQKVGLAQIEWEEEISEEKMTFMFFYYINASSIPFAIPNYSNTIGQALDTPRLDASLNSQIGILGMIIITLSIVTALLRKERGILLPLVLSGLLWILLFRYHAIAHDFMVLLLIGIPLVLFASLFQFITRSSPSLSTAFLAVLSVSLFIYSAVQMANVGHDSESAVVKEQIRQDFGEIRERTRGHTVFINLPNSHEYYILPITWYYLSGSIIVSTSQRYQSDFFVTDSRRSCGLVTHENKHVFLYDSFSSFADCEIQVLDGDPVFSDALLTPYQVYLQDKLISYAHEGPCGQPSNSSETIFLHLTPVRVGDLPVGSQEYGFANLDFLPAERWQDIDGHCIIGVQLPAYDIASIQTGQYDASGQLWSTEIRIAEPE